MSLGAQIDSKASDNRTPFLEAVAAGSVEGARLFLDSGADVFAYTSEMRNCLHLAVDNGHLEMVQLLLENKKATENLYKSDTFERVPLHNAAICPDIKVSWPGHSPVIRITSSKQDPKEPCKFEKGCEHVLSFFTNLKQ